MIYLDAINKVFFHPPFWEVLERCILHNGWFGVDNPLNEKVIIIVICECWSHVKHHKQSLVLNWDPGPWKQSINYRRLLYLLYCCYGISGMSRTCSNVLLLLLRTKHFHRYFQQKKTSHFCGVSGALKFSDTLKFSLHIACKKNSMPTILLFRIFRSLKIAPRINTQRQWCDIQQQDVLLIHITEGWVLLVTSC